MASLHDSDGRGVSVHAVLRAAVVAEVEPPPVGVLPLKAVLLELLALRLLPVLPVPPWALELDAVTLEVAPELPFVVAVLLLPFAVDDCVEFVAVAASSQLQSHSQLQTPPVPRWVVDVEEDVMPSSAALQPAKHRPSQGMYQALTTILRNLMRYSFQSLQAPLRAA